MIFRKTVGFLLEYRVMRLRDFSHFFRPGEFKSMMAAYRAAWQHLRTNRPPLTSHQKKVLKRNLAQMILACACNGKRDIARLKETALRAVSGRLLDRLAMLVPQLLPAALLS